MLYVTSAFSLSMVLEAIEKRDVRQAVLEVQLADPADVREIFQRRLAPTAWESAVGHEGTARVLSEILGVEIPAQRKFVKLQPGDAVLVFQLYERLPEGKVLSESEIREIVERGNWRLVWVVFPAAQDELLGIRDEEEEGEEEICDGQG